MRKRHIKKYDLSYIDSILDWDVKNKTTVHYVEFEIVNPERFERLAKNLDRCGPKDIWTEEEWKEITDEKGDIFEWILIYVHIQPCNNKYKTDIYTSCKTGPDSIFLKTENLFIKKELKVIEKKAINIVKEKIKTKKE